MPDDEEYILNKRLNSTYFSRAFPAEGSDRKRYASRAFDFHPANEVGTDREVIIRSTPAGKQQIKALFRCNDRKIETLILQRFSVESGKAHKDVSFSLHGEEIERLLAIASVIENADLREGAFRLDDGNATVQATDTLINARQFLNQHPDLVAGIVAHDITDRDIVSVGYRRKELEQFRHMLNESQETSESHRGEHSQQEAVWQKFFERNPWIFGYGLSYIFASSLDEQKLEQLVAGASIGKRGSRTDGLLRTRGRVSALCFVEIKTPQTPLLEQKEYRANSWAVSRELAGATAQAHRSVQNALYSIGTRLATVDQQSNPTGELAFLYKPQSVVVVGNLNQFENNGHINEARFGCFQLFRRQLQSPEIITFDELYERARFIADSDS